MRRNGHFSFNYTDVWTAKSSSPVVRKVQFGDGYETRLTYGINQNPKVLDLTFEVSETDADTIETFLDARAADSANFDFTPWRKQQRLNLFARSGVSRFHT